MFRRQRSFNALQTLTDTVPGVTTKAELQSAIDRYHGTIASQVGEQFGKGQAPFTIATPPVEKTAMDFGPRVAIAQNQINEVLRRLDEPNKESNTSSGSAVNLDRQARGRRSLILAGPQGDLSTASTRAPSLLGDVAGFKSRTGG